MMRNASEKFLRDFEGATLDREVDGQAPNDATPEARGLKDA
jgi:hypothetical protein